MTEETVSEPTDKRQLEDKIAHYVHKDLQVRVAYTIPFGTGRHVHLHGPTMFGNGRQ